MDQQPAFQFSFDFLRSKPIVVEPSAAQVTSDAGLLPFRELDEQIGLTRQFADALDDRRHTGYIDHTFLEMTRMRVYGILADYADQNDHDVLRSDPIFKLICGRSIHDDLASQPTLSRFENAIDIGSFFGLRDVLIDQFIASFQKPPTELTLDIDPFDDPTHGEQQLTFFHGYYDQYQYLPRVITCAENDLVLHVCLLYGSAHPALGAADDLEYVVRRLRQAWPDVRIHIRGDSGFGVPQVYHGCERLEIPYTVGIGMNARLQKLSDPLLKEAVKRFEATGQPQRLFCAFWYRASSWPAQRWIVIKCEANAQGTNRRAVVSNRPGAFLLPAATYDEYADRGVELRQVGKGFRFQSREKYSEWVSRLSEERPARYSRALLETLAIIAYRQPVTRGDIEDIRGVTVSSDTMRTLQEREWVREVGHRDVPGKPALFGTTPGFLEHFNLKSLSELPPLSELRDLEEISRELNFSLDFGTEEEGQEPEGGSPEESAIETTAEAAVEPTGTGGGHE